MAKVGKSTSSFDRVPIESWRSVIEATRDYIMVLDMNLKITYVNRAQIGLSLDEVIDKPLLDVVQDSSRDIVKQALTEVLKSGKSARYYTEYQSPGKENVYFESDASTFTVDDEVAGVIVVSRDITARKWAETALNKSERYSRMLFDRSIVGLALCRMDGELVDVNAAFARIVGRTIDDTLNLTYWDLTPEKYSDDEQLQLEKLTTTGAYGPYDKEYIHKDGHLVPVRLRGSLLEQDGETFIWSTAVNITEDSRMKEELQQSQQMLRLVLDAIPVRVFWKDRDCVYRGCNRLFAADAGLESPEQIVGKTDFDATWHDQAELYRADDRQVMDDDTPRLNFEEPQTTPDGRHLRLRTSKIPLRTGDGSVVGVLGVYEDITERKVVETELQENRKRRSEAEHMAKFGHWQLNLVDNILEWSDEIYRIFEIDPKKFNPSYEAFLDAIHPEDRELVNAAYSKSVENKKAYKIEHRLLLGGDKIKHVQERGRTIYADDGTPLQSIGTVQDITERVDMEETVRRSKKMDAIGQLSGGIAHDFNNQLAVIIGHLDILLDYHPEGETLHESVDTANKAALRCTDLTRRLLTFSRRQSPNKAIVDLNAIIRDLDTMIARSVTPEVEVEYLLADNLWKVEINSGEFQDAILNLVINARDAMPVGGKLLIGTSNIDLREDDVALQLGLEPGSYVRLTLSDNGTGMDEETLEHIFEPFFTTKAEGVGTGLGLSMVYGFATRHGGNIIAYSESGVGTIFRTYLPRSVRSESALSSDKPRQRELLTGSESVLIVDDEVALLKLTQQWLNKLGYRTRIAENGRQALDIISGDEEFDLLVTDVIMPGGMDGYELAQQATEKKPGLKVLLTSGFTREASLQDGLSDAFTNLITKPYRMTDLAQRIRLVLDE